MSDVWEIPFLNPKAKERTGYPTQKPIELLDRIIEISTDECDRVLDLFCSSGTTLVSAKLLVRKYYGIDTNAEAIALTQSRLEVPCKITSNLLRVGKNAYKTKSSDELSILQQFDCDIVQRNKGIDAFFKKHYTKAPVALRIQKEYEAIEDAANLLYTAATKKGCSFMILITTEVVSNEDLQNFPNNMIVISKYAARFKCEIEKRLWRSHSMI